jgi:hypothetical protein
MISRSIPLSISSTNLASLYNETNNHHHNNNVNNVSKTMNYSIKTAPIAIPRNYRHNPYQDNFRHINNSHTINSSCLGCSSDQNHYEIHSVKFSHSFITNQTYDYHNYYDNNNIIQINNILNDNDCGLEYFESEIFDY